MSESSGISAAASRPHPLGPMCTSLLGTCRTGGVLEHCDTPSINIVGVSHMLHCRRRALQHHYAAQYFNKACLWMRRTIHVTPTRRFVLGNVTTCWPPPSHETATDALKVLTWWTHSATAACAGCRSGRRRRSARACTRCAQRHSGRCRGHTHRRLALRAGSRTPAPHLGARRRGCGPRSGCVAAGRSAVAAAQVAVAMAQPWQVSPPVLPSL